MALGVLIAGTLFFTVFTYILGRLATPWEPFQEKSLNDVIYVGMGIALTGLFLTLAGHLNLYHSFAIGAFIALTALIGIRYGGDCFTWMAQRITFFEGAWDGKSKFYNIALWVLIFFTLGLCLIPEVANDALCYQLHLPKIFVQQKSVWPIPYELNSYMPLLMNYLYGLGLMFGNVSLAKIFHWLTGVLMVIALVRIVFLKTHSQAAALMSGLALLLTPTLWNQIADTYTDAAMSFFSFLTLLILVEGGVCSHRKNAFLAGILFGTAIGVKFFILAMWAPFLALIWGVKLFRGRHSGTLKSFVFFCAGTFLAGSFWFIRNWVIIGNPVYPYLGDFFGTEGLSNLDMYMGIGLPKTLMNFAFLLWHFTFDPDMFGRGHWIGPVYFLLIPFFIWGLWKRRDLMPYALFIVLFMGVWFFLAQSVRYALPVLPPYLLIASIGVAEAFRSARLNLLLRAGGGLLLLALFALGIYHYRLPLKHYSIQGNYQDFLLKRERSYGIASWMNNNLPENSKILNAEEIRQFYFDHEIVRENFLNIRTSYSEDLSAQDYGKVLRQFGFTHILRTQAVGVKDPDPPQRLQKLDTFLKTSPDVQKIKSLISGNVVEGKIAYDVYQLLETDA